MGKNDIILMEKIYIFVQFMKTLDLAGAVYLITMAAK